MILERLIKSHLPLNSTEAINKLVTSLSSNGITLNQGTFAAINMHIRKIKYQMYLKEKLFIRKFTLRNLFLLSVKNGYLEYITYKYKTQYAFEGFSWDLIQTKKIINIDIVCNLEDSTLAFCDGEVENFVLEELKRDIYVSKNIAEIEAFNFMNGYVKYQEYIYITPHSKEWLNGIVIPINEDYSYTILLNKKNKKFTFQEQDAENLFLSQINLSNEMQVNIKVSNLNFHNGKISFFSFNFYNDLSKSQYEEVKKQVLSKERYNVFPVTLNIKDDTFVIAHEDNHKLFTELKEAYDKKQNISVSVKDLDFQDGIIYYNVNKSIIYKCKEILSDQWINRVKLDINEKVIINLKQESKTFTFEKENEKERIFHIANKNAGIEKKISWNDIEFCDSFIKIKIKNDFQYNYLYLNYSCKPSYNIIKKYISSKLPDIHVYLNKRGLVKVVDLPSLDLAFRIIKNTHDYKIEDAPQLTINPHWSYRKATSIDPELIIKNLKSRRSIYFDCLMNLQHKDYKIIPAKESISHMSNKKGAYDEDAFIFTIPHSYKEDSKIVIFENVNPARATILFHIPDNQYNNSIQTIYNFLRDENYNNKRSTIREGIRINSLDSTKIYSINHTENFDVWKEKIVNN